jgi:hypothetical protein
LKKTKVFLKKILSILIGNNSLLKINPHIEEYLIKKMDSTTNPPAAGRFNERSKMMSEVGRPETEAKKNKKPKSEIRNMNI